MLNQRAKNNIGFDAIVLAIYFATTPIHQTLSLGSIGTITKFLALAAMICVVIRNAMEARQFYLNRCLFLVILPVAIWFLFSLLWSVSMTKTFASLSSIFSYFALLLIVLSKEWTPKEKHLFRIGLIVFSVYVSQELITAVAFMRRATFISSYGVEADQNLLSVNIAMGAVFALNYFFTVRKTWTKVAMVFAMISIMVGVICTGSRGGLLSLFVGIISYFYLQFKDNRKIQIRLLLVSVILVISLLILFNSDLLNEIIVSRYIGDDATNTSGRIIIWKEYLKMLISSPLRLISGFGYGASIKAYATLYGNIRATHNDFLTILCDTGMIGLIFLYRFVCMVYKKSSRNADILSRAIILLMLTACLSVNIFYSYGWWNAIIFAYMGIGIKKNLEKVVYE